MLFNGLGELYWPQLKRLSLKKCARSRLRTALSRAAASTWFLYWGWWSRWAQLWPGLPPRAFQSLISFNRPAHSS